MRYELSEEERKMMKDEAGRYLMFGVVFLAVGITMLMTHAVSSVIAYGDLVSLCSQHVPEKHPAMTKRMNRISVFACGS